MSIKGKACRIIGILIVTIITNIWYSKSLSHIQLIYSGKQNEEIEELKNILLWTDFFGEKHGIFDKNQDIKEISCPQKCVLSRNRSNPLKYHVLVFHTRDEQKPPNVRPSNQIYIAWTWECPTYIGDSFVPGPFYNWSATYARDSTVPLVHGVLHDEPAAIQADNLPQMRNRTRKNSSAIITWVVSHCRPASDRQNYVQRLQLYMDVDIYGGCGIKCPPGKGGNSCHKSVAATGKYKFYLAFENAICKDYISLKPFRALEAGLVPVVMGGLCGDDYSRIMPANSFIDVRNFQSVKHLADYLKQLDRDDKEYMKYHAWRVKQRIGYDQIDGTFTCEVCKALHNKTLMADRHILDFGKYWNSAKMCDNNLVDKLLSN